MSKDSMQQFVKYKATYPDISERQAKLMRVQQQYDDKLNIAFSKLQQTRKKYKAAQKLRKTNTVCFQKKINSIYQQINETVKKIDDIQNHIQMQKEAKILREHKRKTKEAQNIKILSNLQTTLQQAIAYKKQTIQRFKQKLSQQRHKKEQLHKKILILQPVTKNFTIRAQQLAKAKTIINKLSNKKQQCLDYYKELMAQHKKKLETNKRLEEQNEQQKQKTVLETRIIMNSMVAEIQTIIDEREPDDLQKIIKNYRLLYQQQSNSLSNQAVQKYQQLSLRKLKSLPDDRWHKQALQEQFEQLDKRCQKLQHKLRKTMQIISNQQQQINNFKDKLNKTIEAIRKSQ